MKTVFHLAFLSAALIGLTGCGRAKTDAQTSNPPPEAVAPAADVAAPPAANVTAPAAPAAGVSAGAGRVDVAGLESVFRGAEGGAKQEADKAVAFARAGNYLDAWAHAQKAMIKYPTTAPQVPGDEYPANLQTLPALRRLEATVPDADRVVP